MKIFKHTLILILFFNIIVSCTVDDIEEDQEETNAIENIQATGEDNEEIDQTEKG